MQKKIIAFDLDGTLAPSKSPLPDTIAELLNKLLEHYQVCVISGGKFDLFQQQLLAHLPSSPERLVKLHLMPTCGTRYFAFDAKKQSWTQMYAENLTKNQKAKIIAALNAGLDQSGWRPKKTWGDSIEDRDSQITLSILGQEIVSQLGEEGLKLKEAWDPSGEKKLKLRDIIAPLIPEFEVRAGGLTSIDVTKPGIDKAYGMRKLMEHTGVRMAEILYFGDKMVEGGNDFPVKAMGIDSIEVSHWQDTALALAAILHVV
jgi:phosphomannomutase